MFCAVPAPEYARNVINAGYNGSTKLLLLIVARAHTTRACSTLLCMCAIFLVHTLLLMVMNVVCCWAAFFVLFYLLLCAVQRCVYALAETLSLSKNSKQRVALLDCSRLASLKFLASVAAEKLAPCE
jgi:hypothetical protein